MISKITLVVLLGAIIFSLNHESEIIEKESQVKNLEGFVISETSKSEKTSSFIFETSTSRHPRESGDPGLKLLVRTDKYFKFNYGEKISVSGDLKVPENFENENGIVFDYKSFLLKDGITHTAFFPEIKIIEKESKKDFKFYIFKLKNILVIKTEKIFSTQTSSLVLGTLLGIKDSIDSGVEENFRRTGLIHILVLSGFNLTIIAYFFFKIFSFTHRNIRYAFSLIFIFIFTIMVGAGATIVRAAIMISIFIFSKLLRRNSSSLNALLLAASIMIFINPMILLYDASFQLSFVATLGLITLFPVIEKFIDNSRVIPDLPRRQAGLIRDLSFTKSLKDIVVSNIAVQITVVPVLIYLMGEFSVISIIPNLLVLPIIPIFMLISFLSICVSFVSFNLALPLIFISEKLSDLIIFIVNLFGELSFAIIKTGILPLPFLLIFLFLYFATVLFLNLRQKIIYKQKYSYLL